MQEGCTTKLFPGWKPEEGCKYEAEWGGGSSMQRNALAEGHFFMPRDGLKVPHFRMRLSVLISITSSPKKIQNASKGKKDVRSVNEEQLSLIEESTYVVNSAS